jgi:hypothetical protein
MIQKPRNNKFALTPPPAPHIPTFRGWYFFGRLFGFMRVCGKCCGLWRRWFGAVKVKDLSLGVDSLGGGFNTLVDASAFKSEPAPFL